MNINRQTEIFNAAHEFACFPPTTLSHSAFEVGAKWADDHPSRETILSIIKTLHFIKYKNKNDSIIDMNPYPIDEQIINEIQQQIYKSIY